MQALWGFIGLFFTAFTYAEEAAEKTVQVGKHVSPSTDVATMIVSLLIVLLVVVASAYILKKFQITAQGGQQALKVVSSVHLGSKERVIVVQVEDKQLVLGVTAHQVNLLDTLDKPIDTTASKPEPFDKSVFNTIKNSLKKNDLKSGERVVIVDNINGKESETRFRIIQKYQNATLVRAFPVTGRTHQIRVHCQVKGHSIACDNKYGNEAFDEEMRDLGLKRLFLHAASIEFTHPLSNERVKIEAPLDKDLQKALNKLVKSRG